MIRLIPAIFCLFIISFGKLGAQVTPACPSPPPPGAESCPTTCVYCDFDGYMGINGGTPSGGNTVCGSIAIHNDQWFGFVAGTTSITIDILTSNCQNGDGLQAAFFDDCTGDAITCNPGSGGGGGAPLTLTYSGFIPGQTYYLMIDGWVGDVCNYEIDVVDGSITPPPVTAPSPPQGPTQVCPGATVVYSIPDVPGAGAYRWQSPAGSSINGGTNNRLLPAPEGTEVTITFGNAGGQVCVTASNACSAPLTSCITVTNQPIPPTVKPAMVLCFDDLPYQWDEPPYQGVPGPGTYNFTSSPYDSYLGCDSTVKQTIIVKPKIETNLGVKYICEGECFEINGIPYCESGGPYNTTFDSYQGCDSLVRFSVVRIPSNAVIQTPPPMITCANPTITLNGSGSSSGPQVNYFWYNSNWTQIGNTNSIQTSTGGTYHLVVLGNGGGLSCRDTATVTVTANNTPPGVTAAGGTIGCLATNQQITLSATSATPGVSYQWAGPGITPANALLPNPTVTATGTYSVSVTNPSNNCTSTATVVVDANNTPPSATASGGTITCANPSVTLGVSTNAPSANYNWSGPNSFNATSPNPSVNNTGNYSVTVTNSITGCTSIATTSVNQNTTVPTANAGPDGIITCVQSSVTLTGSGNAGGAPFIYNWTGPGINTNNDSIASPVVTATGTYILEIANQANGCSTLDTAVITASLAPPTVTAGGDQTITCADTAVTLSSTGSASGIGFTRIWSGPGIHAGNATNANPLVNQPGNYTLVVTNTANGCSASDQVTVIMNQTAPTANAGLDQILTCSSTNGIALQGSGSPVGITYLWSGLGVGANNNTQQNPVVTQPDTYTLQVTNPVNGCTATDQVVISQDANVPSASAGPDRVLNCSISSVDLNGNASSTGPDIQYSWAGPGINAGNSNLQSPLGITQPGTYNLTVTNTANNCFNTDVVVVTLDTLHPIANAGPNLVLNCYNSAQDTIDATGSDSGVNFNLQWTGAVPPSQINSPTPVVNTPGVYTLTVTNLTNTCTSTDAVSVTADLSAPAVNAGTDKTIDCIVTSAVLGGSPAAPGLTYSWMGTGINSTTATQAQPVVSQPGTYSLIVTSTSNGCTSTDQAIVNLNAVYPVASAGNDQVLTCTNPSALLDGSASSNGANMAITWSGPDITPANTSQLTPSVTVAGTYIIRIQDQTNSCTSSDTVLIDADQVNPVAEAGSPAILNCLITSLNLSSTGSSSGTEFIYEWSGPAITPANTNQTSPSINMPGLYTLVITDQDNGCTDSDQVTINQDNILPMAAAGNDLLLTCAVTSINLDGSGSSSGAGITYAWAGPAITLANFSLINPMVSDSGLYTLQVTNENNHCTATDQVYVALDAEIPAASAGTDQLLTCSVTNVTLDGSQSAAGAGITYAWSGPDITPANATLPNPTVTLDGLYTLTVNNTANGCTNTDQVLVDLNTIPPFASAGNDQTLNCDFTALPLDAGLSDNGSNFSIQWSGPAITPANSTSVAPVVDASGVYTVVITNTANGCTASDDVSVSQDFDPPISNAGTDQLLNCNISQVTLDGTGSNSPGGIIYNWQGPGITPGNGNESQLNVTIAGNYLLTVENPVSGCTAIDTVFVAIDTVHPVLTTTTNTITCSQPIVQIGVSSSLPNTAFLWQGPSLIGGGTTTNPNPQVDGEGLYTVLATSPNGCSSTAQVIVELDSNFPEGSAEGAFLNCYNNGVDSIFGSVITLNSTYRWQGPNGFTSLELNPQVSVPGNYRFIIRGPNGCERTLQVTVTANFTAPTAVAQASNTLDCNTPTATIIAAGTSTGSVYSNVWSTSDGNFVSGINSLNPVVDAPGSYTIAVTNTLNGCTNSATAIVEIDPSVPTGFYLNVKDIRCWGETNGSVIVDSVEGGTTPFYFTLTDALGSPLPSYFNLAAGDYKINLLDANGCEIDSTFSISEPNQLIVELGDDATVLLGDSIEIIAQLAYSTPLQSIRWNPSSGCDSVNCESFWVKPFNSIRQYVTVTDSNGCVATDEQLIFLDRTRRVYIPNAFYPESLQNNLFQINCGNDVLRIASFRVFDRWGELVYEAFDRAPNDPNLYWDGQAVNKPAVPGVFVYMIEVEFKDGEKILYNGDVTLVR